MDKYLLWQQLSLVQQLNCVCDTTTKGAVQRAITTGYIGTPTQLLPQEDVAIVIWGNKLTSNVSHPVRFHASKEIARDLLADTRKWPRDRFDEVDWENLDLAMKSKNDMYKNGDPSSTRGFAAPGYRSANTPGWNAWTRNAPTVAVRKRLRTSSYVQTKTGLAY